MLKLTAPHSVTIAPVTRTVVVQPQTVDFAALETRANDARQTLHIIIPGAGPVLIMGEGSPTPYDANWTNAAALAALKLVIPFAEV
jgi:hypothetical protein